MQCQKCNRQNRTGALYCASCGTALSYAPTLPRLQPGLKLNSNTYEVVRPLSRGGMGAIYLVKDLHAFGRLRVLKEMLDYVDAADYANPAAYQDAVRKAHQRFEDEARILAQLRHRGIPEITTYFTEQNRNYIVMEYVEGQDLSHRLTRLDEQGRVVAGRPYAIEEVVRWGIEVCKILEYLEKQTPAPVIHHDIKPANLVLDNSGDVRLVDFGTAKARTVVQAGGRMGLQKSSIFGTEGYAPPEQYQGQTAPKSDVYALAATLYHLATDDDPRNHPFSFPWPAWMQDGLQKAMERAVERDVSKRFTAREFREALEKCRKKPLIQTKPPPPKPTSCRVVLTHINDASIPQAVKALIGVLGLSDVEATAMAYSVPIATQTKFPHADASRMVSTLRAAGVQAVAVEPDERYSQSHINPDLRRNLESYGQVPRMMTAELGPDRQCHCFVCGYDWTSLKKPGDSPPARCPSCKSDEWSLRRIFKCRVCGHEFAHGNQTLLATTLFPSCPACGTSDWFSRTLPALKIDKKVIDLGTLRIGSSNHLEFWLRNGGTGRLRGVVRCREPWLRFEQQFSGDTHISVPITTSRLTGETAYQGSIEAISNGGVEQILVTLCAQTPEKLWVSLPAVNFGQVSVQEVSQTIQVKNLGGGELKGTVNTRESWLEVSQSELIGNFVELELKINPAQLPAGQVVSGSIEITTNGGSATIPARADVLPTTLNLWPSSLDFGQVGGQKVSQTIRVTNLGGGELKGTVSTKEPWLTFSKTKFVGNFVLLVVSLNTAQMPAGQPVTGSVQINTNGGNTTIPVRADTLPIAVSVWPLVLDFGQVAAKAVSRTLQIRNVGGSELRGTVIAKAPWLALSQTELLGNAWSLEVSVNPAQLPSGQAVTSSIDVNTNGGTASVTVQADALPATVSVSPLSLDFGSVPLQELHSLTLQVKNIGAGGLECRVLSWPSWVKVSDVSWSGNEHELQIEVEGQRLHDATEQTGNIRISSNGGDIGVPVRAVALGTTLALERTELDFGALSAGRQAKGQIKLSNLGRGELKGTIHSSPRWLAVKPSKFCGNIVSVEASLRTKGMTAGHHVGAISIESNGGRASIRVVVQITDESQAAQAAKSQRPVSDLKGKTISDCPYCGQTITDKQKFCPRCGGSLGSRSLSTKARSLNKRRLSSKRMVLIGVALVVVAMLSLAVLISRVSDITPIVTTPAFEPGSHVKLIAEDGGSVAAWAIGAKCQLGVSLGKLTSGTDARLLADACYNKEQRMYFYRVTLADETICWISAADLVLAAEYTPPSPTSTLKPTRTPRPLILVPSPTSVPARSIPSTWHPTTILSPSSPSRAQVCCKICTTGKACGDSCIGRDKMCTKPLGCACNGL